MADSVVGRLIYKITGDLGDIKQSLSNVEKRIKNFSKFVESAAGLFGVVTAFKSLINIAKGSVEAFLEQEDASTKFAAALKTTGEYSSTTQKRMEALSSSLQQVTRYGDETTTSAMAMLMSLGSMDSKMASDLIPHVQDFASAMGMDLESAATLVAKAVEGNVGALSRYGIKVEEGLDKQGRMKAITEALSEKFGGLAGAMGDTAGGALIKLQNAFGDMQEEVGRATVTSLKPLVSWLADVATKITGVMQASNDLREALKNQEKGIADTSDELIIANAKWAEARQKLDMIAEAGGSYEKQLSLIQMATAAGYNSIAEWKKGLEDSILVLRRKVNALQNTSDREVKAAAEEAEIARKRQEFADKLGVAYAKTEEAQRIALENEIRYWESVLKTAGASKSKVVAILEDLRAEYAKKFPIPDAEQAAREEAEAVTDAILFELDQQTEAYQEAEAERAKLAEKQAKLQEEVDARLRENLDRYIEEHAEAARQRLLIEQQTAEQIDQIREQSWDFAAGLLSSLGDLQRATLDRELAALNAEQERELEAFEGTEEEKAALIEQHEREKAKLEYDAALGSWRMQLAGAIVSGVRAVLSSYQSLGWPLGLAAATMQGAINAIQIAAIRAAKPVPSFAQGADFTVPPGYPNDSYPMNVESGEHVTVTPAGQGGGEPIHVTVNLDGRVIGDWMLKATRDRRALIDARSIV